MTPFLEFALQWPNQIVINAGTAEFYCGLAIGVDCNDCPNEPNGQNCNHFTSEEVEIYHQLLKTNPEYFI